MARFHTFSEALTHYWRQSGITRTALAEKTGIPDYTLKNWMKRGIRSPQKWQDLLLVANALNLTEKQTNELLAPTKYPSLSELRSIALPTDESLFAMWPPQQRNAPFQAPTRLRHFIGRSQDIAILDQQRQTNPTLLTIVGMGGVGKSTLATELAYRWQEHFPDGVLWARVDTADTLSILHLFLNSFDQPKQDAPAQILSTTLRQLLLNKQALIILDNVETTAQLRPFLPASPSKSLVVATTRTHNLKITREVGERYYLQPFGASAGDSEKLLAKMLAEEVKPAFTALAQAVGHLPLALSILAGQMMFGGSDSAEAILQNLQNTTAKLDTLNDEDISIRATIDLSYQALPPIQQTQFAALSVFSGEKFTTEAVAYILNTPRYQTNILLTTLQARSLIKLTSPDTFTIHPLIHAFAREKLTDQTIWSRYHNYYYDLVKQGDLPKIVLDEARQALHHCLHHQADLDVVDFALSLTPHLTIRGLDRGAESYLRTLVDRPMSFPQRFQLQAKLGEISGRYGNYAQAEVHHTHALNIAYKLEDANLISAALANLGEAVRLQDDLPRAEKLLQDALPIALENKYYDVVSNIYNSLTVLLLNHEGDYDKAESYCRHGAEFAEKHQQLRSQTLFLMNLSAIAFRKGHYAQSATYATQCKSVAQQLNFGLMQMMMCVHDARIALMRDQDYEYAVQLLQSGIELAGNADDQWPMGYLWIEMLQATLWQQNLPDAYQANEKVQAFANRTHRYDFQIAAMCATAQLELASHHVMQADELFQQAFTLSQQQSDHWHFCWALWVKAQSEAIYQPALATSSFQTLYDEAKRYGFKGLLKIAGLGAGMSPL